MKKLSFELLADTMLQKRKEHNITLQQLSALTGINRAMLSRVEKQDYQPSIQQLETLGEVLDFEPVSMFVEEKETSIIKITIHEGKNREVKKMMEYVGYDVLKLNRESFANLNTKGLYQGQYRRLTKEEINDLYDLVSKK